MTRLITQSEYEDIMKLCEVIKSTNILSYKTHAIKNYAEAIQATLSKSGILDTMGSYTVYSPTILDSNFNEIPNPLIK